MASPLGAIGNGAELLEMTGAASGPEVALIGQSVAHANARLRFFRIAFGAAPPGAVVAQRELCEILAATAEGGRLTLSWDAPGDPERAEAKLIFLVIQCLETVLPRGGGITVSRAGERWRVTVQGVGMTPDPAVAQLLVSEDAVPDPTPATVQFALARDLLVRMARTVTADLDSDVLTLSF